MKFKWFLKFWNLLLWLIKMFQTFHWSSKILNRIFWWFNFSFIFSLHLRNQIFIKLRLKYFTVFCSSNTFWSIHAMINFHCSDAFVSCFWLIEQFFCFVVRVHQFVLDFSYIFSHFERINAFFFSLKINEKISVEFETFVNNFAH